MGDEDVGLEEGVLLEPCWPGPEAKFLRATCGKLRVNPLGKALPFAQGGISPQISPTPAPSIL